MHLLIALDRSPLNKRIGEFLKKFLDQFSELPIVSFIHVIDSRIIGTAQRNADIGDIDMSGGSLEDENKFIRQLRKDSRKVAEEIQEQLGVIGLVDFPIGDPCKALIETCLHKKPDLLIIGTHSRKGINRFLFGNFAEKVLRHVQVPLIIIPEKG